MAQLLIKQKFANFKCRFFGKPLSFLNGLFLTKSVKSQLFSEITKGWCLLFRGATDGKNCLLLLLQAKYRRFSRLGCITGMASVTTKLD